MKTSTQNKELTVQQSESTEITTTKKRYEKRYSLSERYFRGTELEKYWIASSIGLILISFVPGADFGLFKIPNIQGEIKGYLLFVGLILLVLYLLCHIAWFKDTVIEESTVNLDAIEAELPGVGSITIDHRVRRLEGVQDFIRSTSGVNLFTERFHNQFPFKDMVLTWLGNGSSGARGSLVFNTIENPLLKDNITLLDYADELYATLDKTGFVRNRNVSTSPNMNIAVQWYIVTVPDRTGKLCDVYQLSKIVVMGEWLTYLIASYTDAATPDQKSVLLETFEKFGS